MEVISDNTVALAALAVLGTAVTVMAWLIKFVFTKLSNDIQEHTKAALKQASALDNMAEQTKMNRKVNGELYDFMVRLNGSLKSVVEQKQRQS